MDKVIRPFCWHQNFVTEITLWHIMGQMVSPRFLGHFNWIFVKIAGNKDRVKISDEFKFRPGWTFHYWVIFPWVFPLTLNGEKWGSPSFLSYYEFSLHQTYNGKKGKTMDFSETIVIYDLELATDDRRVSVDIKTLSPGGCMPPARGYIHY